MKIVALMTLTALVVFAAEKNHNWQPAKVLDSASANTRVVGKTGIDKVTVITDSQLLLEGPEYAYVISDSRSKPGLGDAHGAIIAAISNRNHCRYIVGDSVRFFQEKNTLHLIDADGKECKAEILRQERIEKKP